MSQKINPLSTRLGISQLWKTNFPKYGKKFKSYTRILHIQLKIFVFLKRFLAGYGFLIENIHLRFTSYTIFINVFVINTNNLKSLPKTKSLPKIVYYWSKIPITFNFYKKLSLVNSAFLVSNYMKYLVLHEVALKKALPMIYKLLKDYSINFKLVQTVQGIGKVTLKGVKLKLSGCFEISRSQMSKTIKCNFGSLPLTKLNGYIEYSDSTIYTKFGSCGLKVWLFYELKPL